MRTWTVALYVAGKSGSLDMIKKVLTTFLRSRKSYGDKFLIKMLIWFHERLFGDRGYLHFVTIQKVEWRYKGGGQVPGSTRYHTRCFCV